MQLSDNESELLRKWITKKLEDISDADSDVLADYVLALVKTEDAKPVGKANVAEPLKDFLGSNTDAFVEEIFQAIATKSFDPNRPPPKPAASVYQPPKRQSVELPRQLNESKKRSYSYHDWDREEDANGQIQSYQGGERPVKHARRGARGYDQRSTRQSLKASRQYGMPQRMPQLPTPPPGMPQFDPNNPMASMLAMQQMMGMFPDMVNGASPTNGHSFKPPQRKQRCRDYDVKGFCAAGASCPYEHGEDTFVVPIMDQEYDPNNSMLLDITPTRVGHVDTSLGDCGKRGSRGRGRGRGGSNFRGGNKRSNFSLSGPARDRSNTTIVVEQIPDENFNDESVRSFFQEFGNIEDVTLLADKKVAIVKYDGHQAAKNAYESPKVVFDNRFVKVYWHKAVTTPAFSSKPSDSAKITHEDEDQEMQDGEEALDIEELTKRQEEAQRKHDDAKKQREDAEKQKQDLDAKLKAVDEERKKMADLIAKRAGKESLPLDDSPTHIKTEESDQTKALKAQLAKVEAEARSLGLDPDAVTNGYSGYSSYRGRGGYRGRGRGRGSYRGYRGGWAGTPAFGGAVKRLDNRPKTVAVTFGEGTYDNHDEALRQFLLFNSLDSASLSKHPDRDDTALVTFNHRYEGEMFMDAAGKSDLLHVGKVDLSWHKLEDKSTGMNGALDSAVKTGPAETMEPQSADVQVTDGYDMVEEEDLDRWS